MKRGGPDGKAESRGDTARFLGLTGPGGWAVAGLFLATQLILAFTSNAKVALSPPDLSALAILIAITIVVMFPGRYPLSHVWSVVIVIGCAVITVLVDSVLPVKGWPGYESWQFGANTLVLLALGLRGRNTWAWVGMLTMTALTVYWTVSTGQGVVAGINLIDRNAGTLLIGTVFSIGIRRSIRWITALNAAEQQQVADDASSRARLHQRRTAMASLNAAAVPALTAIAESSALAKSDRQNFLVIEASLRDAVRAPGLAREPLASAVTRARSRGQEIILFDDDERVAGPGKDRDAVLAAAGQQLLSSTAKRITIRLAARPDSGAVLTMVEDGHPQRVIHPAH